MGDTSALTRDQFNRAVKKVYDSPWDVAWAQMAYEETQLFYRGLVREIKPADAYHRMMIRRTDLSGRYRPQPRRRRRW